MSAPAKLVLLNLLERLGQNSSAWPSQKTISADTGLSERTVRDALRDLEEMRFITTQRRGPGATNAYDLDLLEILRWAEPRRQSLPVTAADPAGLSGNSRRSDRQDLPIEGIPKEEITKEDQALKSTATREGALAVPKPGLNEVGSTVLLSLPGRFQRDEETLESCAFFGEAYASRMDDVVKAISECKREGQVPWPSNLRKKLAPTPLEERAEMIKRLRKEHGYDD